MYEPHPVEDLSVPAVVLNNLVVAISLEWVVLVGQVGAIKDTLRVR